MKYATTILALALMACAEPATPLDAGHAAPDMGGCLGLSAVTDSGPVANVYAYPDGHPCEGGTCWRGECVP